VATSITDEQRVDEADWLAFQRIGYMRDHWSKPEWPAPRSFLSWYVVFDDAQLSEHVESLQRQLSDLDYLDLVPSDALHLTVQGVEYTDRLTPYEMDRIADSGRQACADCEPFALLIGPIGGYAGGAFLRATHAPAQHLRDRLNTAVRNVLGDSWSPPNEPTTFKPHVSITYCHAAARVVAAAEFIERIRGMRDVASIEVQVACVDLVELRREQRVYRWDHRSHVEL
jgi:hypothetical protein